MIHENSNQFKKEKHDNKVLLAFAQPLTVRQVSKKTCIPMDACRYIIAKHIEDGQLICLNSKSRKNRLYWLTQSGILLKKKLCEELNITFIEPDLPDIDWQLYGWAYFNHRYLVIKTLTMAMQPSKVKKVLRFRNPGMKISANNVRDVMQLLLSKGIVRPVKVKNRLHLRYELTELGIKLRQLLMKAEMPL